MNYYVGQSPLMVTWTVDIRSNTNVVCDAIEACTGSEYVFLIGPVLTRLGTRGSDFSFPGRIFSVFLFFHLLGKTFCLLGLDYWAGSPTRKSGPDPIITLRPLWWLNFLYIGKLIYIFLFLPFCYIFF